MPELTPPELARLAVSLTDVDLRDALVAWICPVALTLDLVPEALREQMVDLLPAPLTVLASFTWWRGDGALTRIALDRALAVDPDYRLARLLSRMVDLAIRPFGVPA